MVSASIVDFGSTDELVQELQPSSSIATDANDVTGADDSPGAGRVSYWTFM